MLRNRRDEEKWKDCGGFNMGGKAIMDNLSIFKSMEYIYWRTSICPLFQYKSKIEMGSSCGKKAYVYTQERTSWLNSRT